MRAPRRGLVALATLVGAVALLAPPTHAAEAPARHVVHMRSGAALAVARADRLGDSYRLQLPGGGAVTVPAAAVLRVSAAPGETGKGTPVVVAAGAVGSPSAASKVTARSPAETRELRERLVPAADGTGPDLGGPAGGNPALRAGTAGGLRASAPLRERLDDEQRAELLRQARERALRPRKDQVGDLLTRVNGGSRSGARKLKLADR